MPDMSDRQRREEALRALAGERARAGAPGTASKGTMVAERGGWWSGTRRWISLGVLVAVVVVAIGGALLWPRLTAHPHTPQAQTPMLQAMVRQLPEPERMHMYPNIACPQQAAWLPDGRQFVVLGWAQCGEGTSPPQNYTAIIYRYKQGLPTPTVSIPLEREFLFNLLPANLQGQANSPALLRQVRLRVFDLVWSPDSTQFAALFVSGRQPDGQPADAIIYDGAGILSEQRDANGGGSSGTYLLPTLLASLRQQRALTTTEPVRLPPLAWDRKQMGTEGGAPNYELFPAKGATLIGPSARSYTWTADHTLQPASAGDGTAPIGNPAGEATFSIWQPGTLTAVESGCGAYTYSNEMPAWSPDGSRLITGLGIQAILTAPSDGATPTSTSGGACAQAGKMPSLPMRDAGLASAVAWLTAHHQTTARVAWRPDGELLAVAPSANETSVAVKGDDPVVLFYDSQAGKLRGQLTAAQLQQQAPLLDTSRPAKITALSWSPKGDSVLVVDGARQMLALVSTP